jgi:hypothetical protein
MTLLWLNVDTTVTAVTESTVRNVLASLISYFGFISYNIILVEFHRIQLSRIFIIRIIQQVLNSNKHLLDGYCRSPPLIFI